MSNRAHPIYFGQITLMRECREATEHRALLARAALILGDCEACAPVDLRALLTLLTWPQFQALLNVMQLHANTAVRWNSTEQALLRTWAENDGDQLTA